MQWVRDETGRLVRLDLKNLRMTALPPPAMVLIDRCYPPRSSHPTCIKLPPVNEHQYELKPHFITMLPKFNGKENEDAYIFISEFEEVCTMLKIQHLTDDAVKLRFIPFALRDNAKKWLYSLVTNSITTWKEFITVFLKKYFSMHKTAKIRGEINQCRQKSGEPFWKYLERFKDLLSQCPHHAIECNTRDI
jgi:hypothetical protein